MAKHSSVHNAILLGLVSVTAVSCAKNGAKSDDKSGKAVEAPTAQSDALAECQVEDGFNFTTAGVPWPNRRISYSYMPDGVVTASGTSSLFSVMDAQIPRDVWQQQMARALATWAASANVNFYQVSDGGQAAGASGIAQADSKFGDIRIGTRTMTGTGYGFFPQTSGTNGGDIYLKPNTTWKVGALNDVYSNSLHELGHALGLNHSVIGTVMTNAVYSVYSGLSQDDIDGVQSLYGARPADQYDASASNEDIGSPSSVAMNSSGASFVIGDLKDLGDIDHYRLVVPAAAGPVISISALAGESLLAPVLRLYDSAGAFIVEADAASYGQGTLLQLAGVVPGEEYIVAVDSNRQDVFGIGAYRLAIEFRASEDGVPYAKPANLAADARELNDSLSVTSSLGTVTNSTFSGLSIHWAWDQDYYTFKTATTGKTYQVALTLGSGTEPLNIEVYNATGAMIASSNGQASLNFAVSKSTNYRVRIHSPSATPRAYSMKVMRLN